NSLPNYLCRFTVRAVYILPAAFLGSVNQQLRLLNFSSPSQLTVTQGGFAYPDHSLLGHALPSACLTILLRHHFTRTIYTGTGISACRPSPTRLRLGLGPDSPRADEPSSGNLSHSVDGIPTRLSLLTPAFSLLSAPHVLTIMLRCT